MEVISFPSGSMEDVATPSGSVEIVSHPMAPWRTSLSPLSSQMSLPLWLRLELCSPTGFVVAVVSHSCSALNLTPPLRHTEDIAPPHILREDVVSPAVSARGSTPGNPDQLRDITSGCPGPPIELVFRQWEPHLKGSVRLTLSGTELHYPYAPACHMILTHEYSHLFCITSICYPI